MNNEILHCPHCIKQTKIKYLGTNTISLYSFIEEFSDKKYIDNKITASFYLCEECNNNYTITGNQFDGFKYLHFGELK